MSGFNDLAPIIIIYLFFFVKYVHSYSEDHILADLLKIIKKNVPKIVRGVQSAKVC